METTAINWDDYMSMFDDITEEIEIITKQTLDSEVVSNTKKLENENRMKRFVESIKKRNDITVDESFKTSTSFIDSSAEADSLSCLMENDQVEENEGFITLNKNEDSKEFNVMKTLKSSTTETIITSTQHTQIEVCKTQESSKEINHLDNTFEMVSKKQQYLIMKRFCEYMNKPTITFTYTEWCYMAMTLNTSFGYTQGLELFHLLSDGWNEQTKEYVTNQYYNIINNQTEDFHISSLSRVSSRCGFNFFMTILSFVKWNQSHESVSSSILELLINELQERHGWYKPKIHASSLSPNARMFIIEFSSYDGEVFYEKLTISMLKDLFKDCYKVIRQAWTVCMSDATRTVSLESKGTPMSLILDDIKCSLDKGYLTPTDISNARKSIKRLVPTDSYNKGEYNKESVISKLVEYGLILSDKSTEKRIDGKKTTIYQ